MVGVWDCCFSGMLWPTCGVLESYVLDMYKGLRKICYLCIEEFGQVICLGFGKVESYMYRLIISPNPLSLYISLMLDSLVLN